MSVTEATTTPTRFIRLRELLTRVPLSRTRIYELVNEGRFPRPFKIAERCSAWDADEVTQWMAERIASRDKGAA